MSLATTASLIIATFELNAVRSIRGAMLAADIASGRGQPASGLGPAPNPDIAPRRKLTPEPVYEARRRIEPSPRYEERTVVYTLRYEMPLEQQHNNCPVGVPPVDAAQSARPKPFPPVWASLPPIENPSPVHRPIKVVRHHPDIRHRGIVIDVHA